jgi:hypothetical protein
MIGIPLQQTPLCQCFGTAFASCPWLLWNSGASKVQGGGVNGKACFGPVSSRPVILACGKRTLGQPLRAPQPATPLCQSFRPAQIHLEKPQRQDP